MAETQAQQLAGNAADRVSAASAEGTQQKMLDLQAEDMLRRVESGEHEIVAADEIERLRALDSSEE